MKKNQVKMLACTQKSLLRKFVLMLFLIGGVLNAAAQTISISGTVKDQSGEPLLGVSVGIKGKNVGVATDDNGKYQITVPDSRTVLVFTYIGYTPQEITVGTRNVIDVSMTENNQQLNEVVVVGYGTAKVKDLTSAITTIKSEEIMKAPVGQAMQALQGKVAGMQVVSNGGPGNSPTVRVRGIGSYPGSGNENPLYVVDGIFYDNIDFLNTADIATVSVLKDASAASIYGVRAANGVVLIETRSGGYDKKTEITYDGYYGVQQAQNILKMSNAQQFTTMVTESGSAADISYIQNAMQRYGRSRIDPSIPDVNTDWYKEVIQPAPIQNHSLDVTGGGNKASYSIGLSYFGQDGLLNMKNEYNRFNLRSKLDFKATNWLTIGSNMLWSQATKYPEQAGAWNQAYFAVPILPVYDDQNTVAFPTKYANAKDLGYRDPQNPFPTLNYHDNKQDIRKLLATFYLNIDFIPKKLSFKSTYSNAYSDINQRTVNFPYAISQGIGLDKAEIYKYRTTYSDQTWDNILTYNGTFGDHSLTAMAGTSFRDQSMDYLTAEGIDFPYQDEASWYIHQSKTKPSTGVDDDGMRQYGFSYFGRLSYNFKNRYLLYGTFRADGSSKYQEKWGYFPSIGAGWVISEESFLKGSKAIDFLKLRLGWGQLGNDKVQASDGATTSTIVYGAINDVRMAGIRMSGLYSSLKWEVTEETNVGLTAKFLKNRLSLDADYFIRDTKNAVVNVQIPMQGGQLLKNVGIIRNSGFEVALNWEDAIGNDFRYHVGANIATLKNEVRDLFGQPYIDGGSAEFRQRSMIGQPLLAFFGYQVAGVYQNDAEVKADPVAVANGLIPGDLKYKDTNGDGKVNDDDRVILGSYFPNFTYGANLGVSYKAFDLSFSLMGQSGNKILNRKRGQYIWTNDTNIDADVATHRWHGEGTSNSYPSAAGLRKGWNQKMSTYFVEDGSFFRIQNVQLAYNLRNQNWFGAKMPDMRVTLTADRPLTVFKYNGFNPEVADGIDMQTYPVPAVYTVGLNIKF